MDVGGAEDGHGLGDGWRDWRLDGQPRVDWSLRLPFDPLGKNDCRELVNTDENGSKMSRADGLALLRGG